MSESTAGPRASVRPAGIAGLRWAALRRVLDWPGSVCRARALMHQFAALADHELRDIGLTRGDLDAARRLPLGADPSAELWRRAEERRREFWAEPG